jgi:O-antigen/teichoic acid export membrane protein
LTSPHLPAPTAGTTWRRSLTEPMFATAVSLMTNTILTNGLGVLFWVVAARLYDPSAVGRDSALVSLMMALSTIGQLDLANAVVRFLPAVARPRGRLVLAAYAVAVLASGVIAGLVIVAAPHVTMSLSFLSSNTGLAVALVAATALWSIFSIQDGVLTALGGARWVPLENAVYGVLKVGMLFVLAGLGATHGTFFAFAIPMAVLLVPVNLLLFRRVLPAASPATEEAIRGASFGRRRLLAFVAQDYAGSMLVQAGLTVLPLVVVALLGARSNAFFYLPLLIVSAFDALFANACTSLIVAGSSEVSRQTELARLMARRGLLLLLPGAVALVVLTPYVLLVFGSDYADHATTMMRLLAIASVPRAAHSLYAALARFRGDGRAILGRQVLSVSALIGGTLLLAPSMGLTGVGLAWLGASVLVLITVIPGLMRALR